MTRQYSPFLSELQPKEKVVGKRTYDPKQLYQYLFDNSDRYGIIIYTQAELADAIKIRYETMNYIISDFMSVGFIEKINKKTFRIIKHPDEIEWTEELYQRLSELRKTHQTYYRRKNKQGE